MSESVPLGVCHHQESNSGYQTPLQSQVLLDIFTTQLSLDWVSSHQDRQIPQVRQSVIQHPPASGESSKVPQASLFNQREQGNLSAGSTRNTKCGRAVLD